MSLKSQDDLSPKTGNIWHRNFWYQGLQKQLANRCRFVLQHFMW